MSEIRENVKNQLLDVLVICMDEVIALGTFAENELIDEILSITELAIVDREAELPPIPTSEFCEVNSYYKAQQDMIKAGWRKVIDE